MGCVPHLESAREIAGACQVLQQVWVVAGQPCGKYLAAVMETTLATMDAHIETDS